MIYRPENVLFLGGGVYLLVFLLSPLKVLVPLELGSFIYIGLTVCALILGSRVSDHIRFRLKSRLAARVHLERAENRLFWMMVILGGTGNLLKMLDKYVFRGVGSLTGFEAREVLIESGSGALSIIGGVLYPFGYIPIFILLGAKALPRRPWMVALAGFLFLIPALDATILLSRSFMLVALAMFYFGVSLTVYQGRVAPLKPVIVTLFIAGLVLSLSILIFSWRLDEMGLNFHDSIYLSGYAYTVVPNAKAEGLVYSGHFLSGLLPITQYFVHSILEFQILWSMNETQQFSGGLLFFAPYVKLLAALGLASEPDLFELFPRVGILTSFWGPFWVDFGWFGPLVMFFLGFLARQVARAARRGEVRAYPLYTYFCVVLFFMPVANFVISAQGMYVINAFILFWFLARRLSRTQMISLKSR